MRELPITTRTVQTEENRHLTLEYMILVDENAKGLEQYSVKITETETGNSAVAKDVTMSGRRVCDLVELLAKYTVTPTGLMDVLNDWL